MIRLLKFLITGDWHMHHWEIHEQRDAVDHNGSLIGANYILRCKHCGDMKKFRSWSWVW